MYCFEVYLGEPYQNEEPESNQRKNDAASITGILAVLQNMAMLLIVATARRRMQIPCTRVSEPTTVGTDHLNRHELYRSRAFIW